jgi:hypothetical protein
MSGKQQQQPIEAKDIKDFWAQAQPTREALRRQVEKQDQQAELEAYAAEHQLVLYRGKAIKPEEYPCSCVYESPSLCQEEKNERQGKGYKDGVCQCRCHTYYEPC